MEQKVFECVNLWCWGIIGVRRLEKGPPAPGKQFGVSVSIIDQSSNYLISEQCSIHEKKNYRGNNTKKKNDSSMAMEDVLHWPKY